MTKRCHPEADTQRAIVHALRVVLPHGSIVHHSANEVTSGNRSARSRQAILQGMGVHRGFADLIVLSGGRVLFLEVKSQTGRLSPAQADFRDVVRDQGFAWALVRSVDDALGALAEHGFTARAKPPCVQFRSRRVAR
ncbi:VRR-NUC domain-containing protein [Aliiruegeria haliotis]|uniref:VRR-NUC domain-containing protein n=1 Tax=Aliiruegeria haliotis TaxID=1280846 RepID=A0A2T0RG28_9RHOB|nr:VRR-NUC domain-containing protein [Aliiruegeria haliotis]PRY20107.1 VRR-NUC domain-containing protein [Aliiruegeria haliotis]